MKLVKLLAIQKLSRIAQAHQTRQQAADLQEDVPGITFVEQDLAAGIEQLELGRRALQAPASQPVREV